MLATDGDRDFVKVFEWVIGCNETADFHEDLRRPDIDAISLTPFTGGSECALTAGLYHHVPDSEKMRVEREVWDCFADSRDIRDSNDVSCGGRYSVIDGHVKWLPSEVYYTIVTGAEMRDKFTSLIPWTEEKLKVKVYEASSPQEANLFVHLGAQNPDGCYHAQGCSVFEETFATIYVSAPDEYFAQVLKHEILHSLLPMGHLPQGNYLMSVRPDDPTQTHELTAFEEKLLALYTNPYLRDGIRMELFRQYLIIE